VTLRVPRWLRSPRWLALLAGALPLLAFPAPSLGFIAWVALVPGMIMILRAVTLREAWIRAWWFGAGYLIAALYWMAPQIGPGVLLLGLVFGGLWVPWGIATWRLLRSPVSWPRALAGLVVVPSCWMVVELVRSWQALGGPWNVYGASQWQHPAVLALAGIGGIWLVSFVLVAVNVAVVLVLGSVRLPWRAAAFAVLLVALVGSGPLAFALTSPFPATRQVTIAMVQPGVVNDTNVQTHASQALTEQLSRGGSLDGERPDLIVWGESSIGEDLTLPSSHLLLGQIEALSAADGADILVSQDASPPGRGHEKWAVLVSPRGIKGIYVKTRLVPFGEYIPFRGELGWLTKISKAAASNMIAGSGAHLMDPVDRAGRTLPIGVLVCFESAFPDMSRVDADNGAQLIVYQSETVTFQGTWGPDQHASLAALRAAETGRPVVQAALTGDTVAFDARGRQLAWMGQSAHGVLTVRLSLPSGSVRTLYDRWGDYVLWTSLGIALLSALIMAAQSRGIIRNRAGAAEDHAAQYEEGQSVPR